MDNSVNRVYEEFDVAIIGSGPAGISAALTISQNINIRVLLVESGQQELDEDLQNLSFPNRAKGDLNKYYYSVHSHRRTGGGLHIWGGLTQVFERRSFMNQDWPINYSDLYHYYKGASDFLHISSNSYKSPYSEISSKSNIIYKPYYMSDRFNTVQKSLDEIVTRPNIKLLSGYTCSELFVSGANIKQALLINSKKGVSHRKIIKSKHFVLAAGGIGNPRVLMNSKISTNEFLGKGFVEHPHIYGESSIELKKNAIDKVLKNDNNLIHAIQLSDAYCVKNNINSMSVQFDTQKINTSMFLGRKEEFYWSKINIRSEMPIDEENGINLINKKDGVGMGRFNASFKFNFHEIARRQIHHLGSELIKSGIGRLGLLPDNFKISPGGHIMGTTRMGKTGKESIVDENCRVHGINNLYVAGSSIFPSAGAANPTFTIVALGIRLGEYLRSHYS